MSSNENCVGRSESVDSVGLEEWRRRIDEGLRTGDYHAVVRLEGELPASARRLPRLAFPLVRAHLRQGQVIRAKAALDLVAISNGSQGESWLFALEAARIDVLQRGTMRKALTVVAEVKRTLRLAGPPVEMEARPPAGADPLDAYETITAIASLRCMAAVYGFRVEASELSFADWKQAAERLIAGGRVSVGAAALVTQASQYPDLQIRASELAAAASVAESTGEIATAGDARIKLADVLARFVPPDRARIESELNSAERLFKSTDCESGQINVAVARLQHGDVRVDDYAARMERFAEQYERLEHASGATTVLAELSQWALLRGDSDRSRRYRERRDAIADRAGLGIVRRLDSIALIDSHMRRDEYTAAISLCEEELAGDLSDLERGFFEQLLSSVHSRSGNADAAVQHARRAVELFDASGAEDSASTAAWKLAGDLVNPKRTQELDAAEMLLREWLKRDVNAGRSLDASAKSELLAQIDLFRLASALDAGRRRELAESAGRWLAQALELASGSSKPEAAQRRGGVWQIRAQLEARRGDIQATLSALSAAVVEYESAQLGFEAANTNYLIGCQALNLANEDLQKYFGEAETRLQAAKAYYEEQGMAQFLANALHKLALLYSNASRQLRGEIREQLRRAALKILGDADAEVATVRCGISTGRFELDLEAKSSLAKSAREIGALAMQIALETSDVDAAWSWGQRSKSRAVTELVGERLRIVQERVSRGEPNEDGVAAQLRSEQVALDRMLRAKGRERLAARAELHALWHEMDSSPAFARHLALRRGQAIDLATAASSLPRESAGRSIVYLDWFSSGNSLYLFALRPGVTPRFQRLSINLREVGRFVETHLTPERFRRTLRDDFELLAELSPLVEPVSTLTQPEDLLVCSPTGTMIGLPLAALPVDGRPLLVRNPLVCCPNLDILRQSLARRDRRGEGKVAAALFGNPTGDLPHAQAAVEKLQRRFGVEPRLGAQVTRTTLSSALGAADLVHFQGHAGFERSDPLASALHLSPDSDGCDLLTAREIVNHPSGVRAELVVLAGCETGMNQVAAGDESSGLVPAFLIGGAASVLASLWRVPERAAALLIERFYEAWCDRKLEKVDALRAAMLSLASESQFAAPYYWAAFALNGSW